MVKKIKNIFYFFVFFIISIATIIFLTTLTTYKNIKREGMITRYIKQQIRAPIRNIRDNFSNPTLDYYSNKLNQLLR
jgi:hypothetical protein